jgi:hypothetical protein
MPFSQKQKDMNWIKYTTTTAAIAIAAVVSIACSNDDPNNDPDNPVFDTAPGKAVISGDVENTCPALTVTLTATAERARTYRWYRNTFLIGTATAATYAAQSSGTYYAIGVNELGEGEKSDGKEVIIVTTCPPPAPVISGASANACPDMKVRLTAVAVGADSYVWYRNNTVISGATSAQYDASESGTYSAEAVNRTGTGDRSEGKEVTINTCPPLAPTISGNANNICPEKTTVLTAYSAGATSYQWYWYNDLIPGATAATYLVTKTGAYCATAVNAIGESAKNAPSYVAYIDLCEEEFDYSALLGNYNATGNRTQGDGPLSWVSSITQPEDGGVDALAVNDFADFMIDNKKEPFYIEVLPGDNNGKIHFVIDLYRSLGSEVYNGRLLYAYFEPVFFTGNGKFSTFSNLDLYQIFWDPATQTLDFSGVFTYYGVEYDLAVGISARDEDRVWRGRCTDFYKNLRMTRTASGAPVFTGEKVTGLPHFKEFPADMSKVEVESVPFDPANFSRKP